MPFYALMHSVEKTPACPARDTPPADALTNYGQPVQ